MSRWDQRTPEERRQDIEQLEQIHIQRAILNRIEEIIRILRANVIKPQSLVLTISDKEGNPLGSPATLGSAGGLASVQEFSGPGGTGAPEPNGGPIQYASDNTSVATVDPATGAITSVATGSCNISATDSVNGLSDSVAVTVSLANQSLVLTVTPNPGTAASAAAAKLAASAKK